MEQSGTEIFERKRIEEIYNRLLMIEQSMKGERRKLWNQEKESEDDYAVWDRLEMLSMDIAGYVTQIILDGYTCQEARKVVKNLRRLKIFNIECIMNWYPLAAEEYPKIKEFFELLDYIRLLTLEYVEKYNLPESRQ
ncbi:MAG TPA: hypothetical protein DCL61_21590 [Cyanobacteria bacterium UBA12227]|nr:hypothetical protein [Cyanobacteria bacterium UBA12227]HAX86838.1 hypothetical protein [Cyanobacteria bacterium UBA11370]HBY75535.1 hypothetical protein [Cyanobacteria bacterium UBA11148]